MEIDSKSWLAFLTPIWLCGPYSLITLLLTEAQGAWPRPHWITDATDGGPGWCGGKKEETFAGKLKFDCNRSRRGIKKRSEAERSEALLLLSSAVCRLCTRPPLWGAVSLLCSLCLSIRPSICLSPPSIACVICSSLLCMLKAQLGSQNPLDWCSVNLCMVGGQRRWARGSGFSLFSCKITVWSLTSPNSQIRSIFIWVSDWFLSLDGEIRPRLDTTEGSFSVFLISLKQKIEHCDRWEVEVDGNNQRTARGSCSICLSPPPSFLTRQVLQLRVHVLAALLQPPQRPPGCFCRLSSASQPLCQTSDVITAPPSTSPPSLLLQTSSESRAELVFSNTYPSHLSPSRLSHVSPGVPHFWLPSSRAAFHLLSRAIIATRAMLHIRLLFKAPLICSSFQLRAHKDDWLLAHFPPPAALSPSPVPSNLYWASDNTRRSFQSRNIGFKKGLNQFKV